MNNSHATHRPTDGCWQCEQGIHLFCSCMDKTSTILQIKWFLVIPATPFSPKVNLHRHTGQCNLSLRFPLTQFSKHILQKECRQGSVRGSLNVPRQTEHSSKLLRSCFWFVGGILLAAAILNKALLVVQVKVLQNWNKIRL